MPFCLLHAIPELLFHLHELITGYSASAASLHDSQMCTELLDEDDEVFYADSAYSSAEIAENLPENCKNEICEKGYRGHPLTEEQKKENNRKSKPAAE